MPNNSNEEQSHKDEVKQLKQKLSKLRKKLKAAERQEVMAARFDISPLAPLVGFPIIPPISGVRLSTEAAGIKANFHHDIMLVEISRNASIAGLFTQSSTRSAAVLDCQKKITQLHTEKSKSSPYAFFVNSGNANAFTGKNGEEAVSKICNALSDTLNINPNHIFTASTGVIGESLPVKKILDVLPPLKKGLSSINFENAARAIMTTDTFHKGAWREFKLGDEIIKISGFAKGSGMIQPDMATMLAYIFTDANIEPSILQELLTKANEVSFNCISVDSDTSTSDTILMAATAAIKTPKITSMNEDNAIIFLKELTSLLTELAQLVVQDGEGATKLIEVNVTGAKTDTSAHIIAKSIANSPLVKTAVAGEDPNWGRIVMAVGKSGEPADRDTLSIRFGDILVADNGQCAKSYSEPRGAAYMKQSRIQIHVDIGVGQGMATIWTCDLNHGYITINTDYRS